MGNVVQGGAGYQSGLPLSAEHHERRYRGRYDAERIQQALRSSADGEYCTDRKRSAGNGADGRGGHAADAYLPYFQDVSYGLSCINVNKLNNLLAIIDPDSGEIYSYYRKELYKAIRINKKYITEIETIAVIYDVMAEIAQKYTNRYKKATIDDYNKVLTI